MNAVDYTFCANHAESHETFIKKSILKNAIHDIYWSHEIFVKDLSSLENVLPKSANEDIIPLCLVHLHYSDVIMGSIAYQITSLTIVYSSVYSGPDQRKHQSSASLAFVQGIQRGPVNSPHKGPQ